MLNPICKLNRLTKHCSHLWQLPSGSPKAHVARPAVGRDASCSQQVSDANACMHFQDCIATLMWDGMMWQGNAWLGAPQGGTA